MPLTVTFDTNTLASVVSLKCAQRGTGTSGAIVRTALQDSRIQGFFCETLITLEGIHNKDRAALLGKTEVASEISSPNKHTINIAIGARHFRKPLNSEFSARVEGAIARGMRVLEVVSTMGVGSPLSRESYPIFEPIGGILALKRCRENAQNLDREILKRGVGRAVAIELGLKFSACAGAKPELFHQGLGRACDDVERKRVAKVVREWADGDSVTAHYGFGIDLFCSEDKRGGSILSLANRAWLTATFGVKFVTLTELAALV